MVACWVFWSMVRYWCSHIKLFVLLVVSFVLSFLLDGREYSLKTTACTKPQASFRATFTIPLVPTTTPSHITTPWTTIQIPFTQFVGHRIDDEVSGSSSSSGRILLDTSQLTRIGIVAIGRPMDVHLALSGLRFY
jgi:hypothetical protein